MRKFIILAGAILILGAVNFSIWQKENLLANGRVVLLELAPVDPRSLMQGDYMALRFRIVNDAFGNRKVDTLPDGRIIVAVNDKGIGTFKRMEDGTPLKPDEALMRYRVRNNTIKFATNAFFFQEGHQEYYQRARYGEFRVSDKGDLLLTALRGENLELLGPRENKKS